MLPNLGGAALLEWHPNTFAKDLYGAIHCRN